MSAQPTIVLDEIFDPNKGWNYAPSRVPLKRNVSEEGNPYYVLNVDGIEMLTFEQREWQVGTRRNVPAARLVVMTTFTGILLKDAQALLRAGYDTRGLPSFGIDAGGRITLHAAVPIVPPFPLQLARSQLLACMAILSEEARDLLHAWTGNSLDAQSDSAGSTRRAGYEWGEQKSNPSVADSFLGGPASS